LANPFDYVNTINTTKKNMMRGSENDELAEKGYNAWVVNNALSYFPDTILHANLMNINHHLSARPQYEFFLNSTRSKKRFAKWAKEEVNDDLELVMKYFGYSRSNAKDIMPLLSTDNINEIRDSYKEGGK
jgi:hypothetical protein